MTNSSSCSEIVPWPRSQPCLCWHQQLEFPLGRSRHSRRAIRRKALSLPSTPQNRYLRPRPMFLQPKEEGFWGRVNPFARKSWVKKQTDPINNRLSELDEVNAKNAHDISDVDSRAQAGISKAQSSADQANQTATAAGQQAQQANSLAQTAAGHVDRIHETVNGLDQYKQVTDVNITFRGGNPVLTADAKKQLDDLAAGVTGQNGYILEMEAHSPPHQAHRASRLRRSWPRQLSVT